MISALRSASAVLFYTFGSIVLVLVLLTRKSENSTFEMLLHVLDLPLLLFALVYGGTSLMGSTGSTPSKLFTIIVTAVLALLFLLFLWFNFSFPLSPSGV